MTTRGALVPQSHGGASWKQEKTSSELLPDPPAELRPCFPAASLLSERLLPVFAANLLTPLDSDARGINFNESKS